MRFTILLSDRGSKTVDNLLLSAGFKCRSYVSMWHDVFYPGQKPIAEYVKVARLFHRKNHFVLVVLLDNHDGSSLANAHYIKSVKDLTKWGAHQPGSIWGPTIRAVEQAVIAIGQRTYFRGIAFRFLQQEVVCCAFRGTVKIDRVRHSECSLGRRIRILATVAQKYFGDVEFRPRSGPPSVWIRVADSRGKPLLGAVAATLGLTLNTMVPTGNAQSLLIGRTIHDIMKLVVFKYKGLGKRKREWSEEEQPRRKPRLAATRAIDPREFSTTSVLGKRKRID